MKIAIISATSFEIAPLLSHMEEHGKKASFFHYEYNNHTVYPLVTGIGALKTAFAIARFTESPTVDLAINAGIAGSFDKNIKLGSVVQVGSDRFGDLGVEESDGKFTDVYDLELEERNRFPFSNGQLLNDNLKYTFDIPTVNSITVNKVHGSQQSIDLIKSKYNADIETMEGAGFHYACKTMDMQHLQIRSISNYVEPRNRDGWQIELAIDKLNQTLVNLLDNIEDPVTKKSFGWL